MRLIGCALAALMGASPAAAMDVAIFPVKAPGLIEVDTEALGNVLLGAYSKVAGRNAVGPDEAREILATSGNPQRAAKSLGVNAFVLVTVSKKTDGYLLNAKLYSATGKELYAAERMTAGVKDLLRLSAKVGEEIGSILSLAQQQAAKPKTPAPAESEKPTEKSEAMGSSVTPDEWILLGFTARTAIPVATGRVLAPTATLGLDWRIENPRYYLFTSFSAAFKSEENQNLAYQFGALDLGGSYYLSKSSRPVYVGGGFSLRYTQDKDFGFAPFLALGAMSLRSVPERVFFELRLTQNFLPLGYPPEIPAAGVTAVQTESRWPLEIGVGTGVLW